MRRGPSRKDVVVKLLPAVLIAAVLVTGCAGGSDARRPHDGGAARAPDHVAVVMMENTSIDSLLGNPDAPWINGAAKKYGVAETYFGVTHPSQPNYIALTAGTTAGVDDNSDVTVDVPSIVDQLEDSDRSWRAYMQSYGLCESPFDSECGDDLYRRKHNPFISFRSVQRSEARLARIVDLARLDADLAGDGSRLPAFVWITPDQCNDMHGRVSLPVLDPCSVLDQDDLIAVGDRFLATWVGKLTSSKAWTRDSVVFVTWDEGDDFDTAGCCDATPGGGRILTLVISGAGRAATSSRPYNHYSLLKTIQDAWGLDCLAATCETTTVKAMTDLLPAAR